MLSKLYLVLGAALLAGYAAAAWAGWELSLSPRQQLPPEVRNTPGGYRTYIYPWHSGFRGGK